MSRRPPRSAFAAARAARLRMPAGYALMLVDNRPLQQAAWTQFMAARKRLAKATADLHRHENTDEPAYLSWSATTFPTLLTELRELATKFAEKDRLIGSVEHEACRTGRSPAEVWFRRRNPSPETAEETPAQNPGEADPWDEPFGPRNPGRAPDDEPFGAEQYDEFMNAFFAEQGIDPDDPAAAGFRESIGGFLGFDPPKQSSHTHHDPVREIYRRLVQQLHPDRGGEWTHARARLWHEIQEAWAARDLDWLARLEVEWETAAEVLGPASPVGRLIEALHEIDYARRDADRRVRQYRKHPAWRFSVLANRRDALARRTENELRNQIESMRYSLFEAEDILAYWEQSYPPRRKSRSRRKSGRRSSPKAAGDVPF